MGGASLLRTFFIAGVKELGSFWYLRSTDAIGKASSSCSDKEFRCLHSRRSRLWASRAQSLERAALSDIYEHLLVSYLAFVAGLQEELQRVLGFASKLRRVLLRLKQPRKNTRLVARLSQFPGLLSDCRCKRVLRIVAFVLQAGVNFFPPS